MTRPRRSRKPDQHTPEDQGDTMTIQTISLESDEPAQVLIRELRDADSRARDAHEKGAKALADADRLAQGIADLNRREDEIRAELDQIARTRAELVQRETDARGYAKNQHEERDRKAAAVTSYKRLLSVANIPVDEHLLVPTGPLNGADPAAETRMDRSLESFHAAHDEEVAANAAVDL